MTMRCPEHGRVRAMTRSGECSRCANNRAARLYIKNHHDRVEASRERWRKKNHAAVRAIAKGNYDRNKVARRRYARSVYAKKIAVELDARALLMSKRPDGVQVRDYSAGLGSSLGGQTFSVRIP